MSHLNKILKSAVLFLQKHPPKAKEYLATTWEFGIEAIHLLNLDQLLDRQDLRHQFIWIRTLRSFCGSLVSARLVTQPKTYNRNQRTDRPSGADRYRYGNPTWYFLFLYISPYEQPDNHGEYSNPRYVLIPTVALIPLHHVQISFCLYGDYYRLYFVE